MKQAVLSAWRSFNEPIEGRINWLYTDVKGLVTTGMGNLVDPVTLAVGLPWRHRDGRPAAAEEVAAKWLVIKIDVSLPHLGAMAAKRITDLRLDDDAIDTLVRARLLANEAVLLHAFPQLGTWPADAELALHSMAWALGPGFSGGWPHFTAACRALDFAAAAANCQMTEAGNGGVHPRNEANQMCFASAAAVLSSMGDPDVLHWPQALVIPQVHAGA